MKFGAVEDVTGIEFNLPEIPNVTTNLLGSLPDSDKKNVYIGCPVWGDKGYVGTIYPKGTKPTYFLEEYAKQFNCIEVNATRYGTPPMSTLQNWKEKVTPEFKFSFKMPQVITHRRDMLDSQAREKLDGFLEAIHYFGEKAAMTFMLMPQYMKVNKFDHLQQFLAQLPRDFSAALELRDPEFYKIPEFYAMLKEYQIPLVVTDSPGRRDVMHQILTSDTLFVRFVGNKLHATDFERIDQWVDRIVDWMDQGLKNVYFFMHQPAPYKYMSAEISAHMINQLNKRKPELRLKAPKMYTGPDPQGTLF